MLTTDSGADPFPDRAKSEVTSCAAAGEKSARVAKPRGRFEPSAEDTRSRNGTKLRRKSPANSRELRTNPRPCRSFHVRNAHVRCRPPQALRARAGRPEGT
jgi:hypothetical protein